MTRLRTIKAWYLKAFPEDAEGQKLNSEVTFHDLFTALDNYEDIYNLLGDIDSVVRERCFQKLADIVGLQYSDIYDQWLLASNFNN